MKNSKNTQPISSTLKVVAKENPVSAQELTETVDKPLKDILKYEEKKDDEKEKPE